LAYFSLGEIPHAINLLTLNAETLRGDLAGKRFGGVSLPAVVTNGWLSWCLAETGDFEPAFKHALEAKLLSNKYGQPFDQVQANLGIGGVHLIKGDFAEAIPPLETALSVCDSANIPILVPRVASALGYAYAMAGRVQDALPVAERAAREVRTLELAALRSMCLRWVAEVFLLNNRIDDALQNASAILDHCHATNERGLEAWTLHLIGSAHVRKGNAAEAEVYFTDAMKLGEHLGMRPLVAQCYLSRSRVRFDRGDRTSARHDSSAAASLFLELGMTSWWQRIDCKAGRESRTDFVSERTY